MFVTSGVRFIGKDFLVFALVEYAAFRVCSRNSLFYHFRFTGVISTAGIIPVVVFVEGFLSVRFSVLVYLIKQFVCIAALLLWVQLCGPAFSDSHLPLCAYCLQIWLLCPNIPRPQLPLIPSEKYTLPMRY